MSFLHKLGKLNNKLLRILQGKDRRSPTVELYLTYNTLPLQYVMVAVHYTDFLLVLILYASLENKFFFFFFFYLCHVGLGFTAIWAAARGEATGEHIYGRRSLRVNTYRRALATSLLRVSRWR